MRSQLNWKSKEFIPIYISIASGVAAAILLFAEYWRNGPQKTIWSILVALCVIAAFVQILSTEIESLKNGVKLSPSNAFESDALIARVAYLEQCLRDGPVAPQDDNAQLLERIAELERQLAEATAAARQAPQQSAGKSLSTRERNTLLKLVAGMATAYHGHDPDAKRSGTASEIASDLARIGISIEADTVRKYLREAAETVTVKSA